MNRIASFHTILKKQRHFLIDSTRPQTRTIRKKVLGLFPTTRQVTGNTLDDFLESKAVEQQKYDPDDNGFLVLDAMLANQGKGLLDLGLAPVSAEMSDTVGCTMALYDHDASERILELLRHANINPQTVKSHLANEELQAEEVGPKMEAVIGAYEISTLWSRLETGRNN